MEAVRALPESMTRSRRRRGAKLLGGAAIYVFGVGLLTGCGGDEGPSAFVDCKQNPDGSASVTVDTLHESTAYVGDAETDAEGKPKWRDKTTVDARGRDEFAVTAEGFGPIGHYNDVAASTEPIELFRDRITGSRVVASAPTVDDVTKSAPVVVTFYC